MLDLFHIGTCSFFRGGQILSSHYQNDIEEHRFILIKLCMIGCTSPMMLDLEMLILGHSDLTHGSLALKAYQQNLYLKYYY